MKEGFDSICILDYDKEGLLSKKELIDKFDVNEDYIITLDSIYEEKNR